MFFVGPCAGIVTGLVVRQGSAVNAAADQLSREANRCRAEPETCKGAAWTFTVARASAVARLPEAGVGAHDVPQRLFGSTHSSR